jgi:hypothetical protein
MNHIVLNITHRPYDIVHVIGRAALRIIMETTTTTTTKNYGK